MLICVDEVGQSARESTGEMNVASLRFLPATKGAEGWLSHFFLLSPYSTKSAIIFVLVLPRHELDKGAGRENQRRLGLWRML